MTERPDLLCKFRPWRTTIEKDEMGAFVEHHRTREMLEAGTFFCQPPRFFDDPHDCLQGARATGSPRDIDQFASLNLTGIPDLMRKYRFCSITQLEKITAPEDQVIIAKLARKQSRRQTRVLCLSAAPCCEVMWGTYGDAHRGICLCFDSKHPFFTAARPVLYVENPGEIPDPSDVKPSEDPYLFAKGKKWSWQEEWRLVWEGETPKVVAFPKEALKFVILGEWFQHVGYAELCRTLKIGSYRVRILQMERLPDAFDYRLVLIDEI